MILFTLGMLWGACVMNLIWALYLERRQREWVCENVTAWLDGYEWARASKYRRCRDNRVPDSQFAVENPMGEAA